MESLKGDNQYGLVRRWSTPSAPDWGIDEKYKQTDQNVWMVKCEHCGHWQEMDFEKNIQIVDESLINREIRRVLPGATKYVCAKCGQSLESSRWYQGKWIPRYPDQGRTKGFYVSQLNAVWISSDTIYQDYLRAISTQLFYNYTLGKPFENTSLSLSRDDILSNRRHDLPEPVRTRGDYAYISIGIDWGTQWHHLVVTGIRKETGAWDNLAFYKVAASHGVEHIEEDFSRVVMILNQYDPDIVCADIGFSGNYVDKLKAQFPTGVVYGINVSPNPKSTNDYHIDVNNTKYDIKIDKLMQNAKLISHIKAGRIGFYRQDDEMMELYIHHWGNVLIRDEIDDSTGIPYRSITRKGGDHLAQSNVYSMVGLDALIQKMQDNPTVGGQQSTLDIPENTGVDDMMSKLLLQDTSQNNIW